MIAALASYRVEITSVQSKSLSDDALSVNRSMALSSHSMSLTTDAGMFRTISSGSIFDPYGVLKELPLGMFVSVLVDPLLDLALIERVESNLQSVERISRIIGVDARRRCRLRTPDDRDVQTLLHQLSLTMTI